MAPIKPITVTLEKRTPKKSVVRFDATEDNGVIASVYLDNAADDKLGNPDALKVTVGVG